MGTQTMSLPRAARRLSSLLVASFICRVAWAATTELQTDCYDMEGKRLRYLTWQDSTTCPADSAQHSWRIEPRNCGGGSNDNGRIVYECEDFPGGLGTATMHTTGCQRVREALLWQGLRQLKDFNIDCPSGTVMTEWNMVATGCGDSFRQIRYWCAPPAEGTTTLSCGNYQTSCELVRAWEDLEYLEPLPIACPSSRPFLNRWYLSDSGCGSSDRRMLYNCCEANVATTTTTPLPPSGGAGGDPHFKLWSGTSYDFHGHCDLLLVKSSTFAHGAGLDIHIRSSPYRDVFSYISEAAVRIGHTVLWIGPGGKHSINNVQQQIGQTQALVVNEELQYPVTSSVTKRGRFVFKIHIGNEPGDKEEIILRQFKNWITVNIMNPTETHFQSSQGLLGRFPDGALLGRDGSSVHSNYIDFGSEWVIDSKNEDHLLSEPNPFPGKCHLPSLEKGRIRHRQLRQAQVSVEQAQEACAHWGDQVDNCVSDVIVLGDLAIAEDGPL